MRVGMAIAAVVVKGAVIERGTEVEVVARARAAKMSVKIARRKWAGVMVMAVRKRVGVTKEVSEVMARQATVCIRAVCIRAVTGNVVIRRQT